MSIRRSQLWVVCSILLLSGCASDEVRQLQAGPPVDDEADTAFAVSTTLCRKVGSRTGRRIGVGDEFEIGDRSYVRALVDFANVRPGRTYTVHLVWIRPDGQELFRRYAEVRQEALAAGGFRSVIAWRDAEDLHRVDRDTLLGDLPDFTLDSRLNISTEKERTPGDYLLRVYLDRALLREDPFSVRAAGSEPPAD